MKYIKAYNIFYIGLNYENCNIYQRVMESVVELLTEDSRYTLIKTQDPNKLKIIGSNSDLYDLIYSHVRSKVPAL